MLPFEPEQHSLNRTSLDNETLLSGRFWAELRVFLAVAKAKSFNRAAEILNTSQPTVSRQVKRLQDVVGSQLFISTQHGVKLTDKGEELAKALTRLDHELFSIANDLRADAGQAEGIVRVSVTDGLNTIFVAPALQEFSSQYPKIQVHLKSPLNLIDLRENQTDLMIGACPAQASDILVRRLGSLHFVPIASTDYVHRCGPPAPGNLENHAFVQSEYYAARTGVWDAWNRAAARGRIAHFCDNPLAYGMLVKSGLGIGLLGSYVGVDPTLMPLQLGLRIPVPLYILALSERLGARPVRHVFDWLSELLGNNPWFSDDFRSDSPPSAYDAGYRKLFNIPDPAPPAKQAAGKLYA